MTTIRDLATQTDAQPYEVAAYLDLGVVPDTFELSDEQVAIWLAGE